MITILGPTATGKTRLAAHLAHRLDGEIISADSRQVYRGMDIGTGKDYQDYIVDGRKIPCHLVDIVDPGYHYSVYEYQRDFLKAYEDIQGRGKMPVLCGGTGMYLEAVLGGYKLIEVPENRELRDGLSGKSMAELTSILQSFRKLHNVTDIAERKRLVRAIEIEVYYEEHPEVSVDFPKISTQIFGIRFERQVIRKRITERLRQRLEEGMTEEVETLLDKGLKPEQLKYYGLEYRYITEYLTGELTFEEMFRLLNTAIHQFARRQMTWFRRMERKGFSIHWIEGGLPLEEKVQSCLEIAGYNH